MKNYCIKEGYQARTEINYFDDTRSYQDDRVFQPDVYALARYVAERTGADTIVDFGCGIGRKLAQFKDDYNLIGLDIGSNAEYCKQHYDFGQWFELDFDQPHELPLDNATLARSVVVCSDVIEHVIHPEHLIESFRRVSQIAKALLVSTPERDVVRGIYDMGPPRNKQHIREWNLAELVQLCQHYKLPPIYSGLTVNTNQDLEKAVSLCLFAGNGIPAKGAQTTPVLAIVDTLNHGKTIKETLKTLLAEGVALHVIDGGSTDNTAAIAESFKDRLAGFESLNDSSADRASILNRKQEIAANHPGTWILDLHGDETLDAIRSDVRGLKEALAAVSYAGYNAVECTTIEIFCGPNRGASEKFRFAPGEPALRAWYQADPTQNPPHEAHKPYPFHFLLKRRTTPPSESEVALAFPYEPDSIGRDYLVEAISGIGADRTAASLKQPSWKKRLKQKRREWKQRLRTLVKA